MGKAILASVSLEEFQQIVLELSSTKSELKVNEVKYL